MQRSTLILTIIIIAILTSATAWIVADNTQYTSPITIKHGVAYAETSNGMQSLDTIHENDIPVVSVKPIAIKVQSPITLPNTSAPHGEMTCTLNSHGVSFTVQSDDCTNFK